MFLLPVWPERIPHRQQVSAALQPPGSSKPCMTLKLCFSLLRLSQTALLVALTDRQICRDLCVIYFVPCPAESPHAQLLMELLKVFPLQHQFHDLFWLILQLKRRVGRAGRNSSSFQTIPPLVPQRDRKSLPLQHQDNIRIRQGCP